MTTSPEIILPNFPAETTSSLVPSSTLPRHYHPFLKDVYHVGPDKPLGYLPRATITGNCRISVRRASSVCRGRGLSTLHVYPGQGFVHSGALFAYDELALDALLQVNTDILLENDWPTETQGFVRNVAREESVHQNEQPELYGLIATAFADSRIKQAIKWRRRHDQQLSQQAS